MAKINAKSKRGDAERAAVHYAREIHGCIHTRRAVKTKWQSVDFFGSDVVGKKPDGSHVYIQATAGQYSAVTSRRRKLESIPWHKTDIVELVQLIQTIDPANARKKKWFFRVHEYRWMGVKLYSELHEPRPISSIVFREWTTKDDAVEVPREWFKAWKDEK